MVGGVLNGQSRQQPCWMAWRVSENTLEITACEAITVAAVASATSGMVVAQSGARWKNGFPPPPGCFSANARPWPK